MSQTLFLHHEIVLLALNDKKGTFTHGMYLYSIAGGLLSELLLQDRIKAADDGKGDVTVPDQDLPDDEILCEVIQLIKACDKPRNLSHWVSKAAQIRDLPHRVAGQLAEKGIVTADEKKVLWVFSRRIYPELDGTFEDEIRQRMAALMFRDAAADARTTVLVALARHAGLLKENFAPAELEQHQERIVNLASGNILAEGATQETIKAIQTAIIVAAIVPSIVASTVATGR
ncbi:MAG: GPP34 family phosphoprotein [Planctomycetaceae bacterium]|nr:GPP34 family phosphoprotein [Planctomycetaceae bacterium]